jgi:SRSO17 transposase
MRPRQNRTGGRLPAPARVDITRRAQIRGALAAGIAPGTVLADAGYGNDGLFRAGITALGLDYVVGVQSNLLLWKPEANLPLPLPGKRKKLSRPDRRPHQVSAKELVLAQPAEAWRDVIWRAEDTTFRSRFMRLRIRPATRDPQPAEEWLLVEWPENESEPTKYWLSTLPADIAFEALVDRAKLRWRIERDYQDLKQEVGLGHYEGRGWRGLHHHVTLCIAAYGFLIAERAALPPCGQNLRAEPKAATLPRYRGSAQSANTPRTAYTKLDRNHASEVDAGNGTSTAKVSLLRENGHAKQSPQVMTQ